MESRRAFLGRCGPARRSGRRWAPEAGRGRPAAGGGVRPGPAGRAGGVRDGAGQGGRGIVRRYPHQPLSQPGRRLRVQADRATGKPVEVPSVSDSGSFGFGLRVLADGAWGFSASHEVTREAIARAAAEAVEIARANAPLRRRADPAGARRRLTATPTGPRSSPTRSRSRSSRSSSCSAPSPPEARKVAGVFSVIGSIDARLEDRFFVSSEGSVIEQHVYQISPEFTATAVQAGRKVKSRHLPAARGLRRLRGGRAGRHGSATRGGSAKKPSRTSRRPRSRPASRTSSSCRPTWA